VTCRTFGIFGWLALALAAVGLHCVVSYTVAQRTTNSGFVCVLHLCLFESRNVGVGIFPHGQGLTAVARNYLTIHAKRLPTPCHRNAIRHFISGFG
jgi:hypothetical protein